LIVFVGFEILFRHCTYSQRLHPVFDRPVKALRVPTDIDKNVMIPFFI